MDFGKIKLVIWDLDNTFWSGTISEGKIQSIPENIKLILALTECGIINSICSKNTFKVGAEKLKELEVFDYFVFPSIDWTSKGQRVSNLIEAMSLRAENVLFIDDEILNQEEIKYYSPEIMVASPDIIPQLSEYVDTLEKKDLKHTRLEQYKLLERKEIEQKKYDNNEDFLYASNIKVDINPDCYPESERIHELILRSNQLNFTKKRISEVELKELLDNKEAACAYVAVNDKFGHYGIVGFYAVLNNRLEHFLFSCRTIGLGVEQYVYSKLNFPRLEVVGEVASGVTVAEAPSWINQDAVPENQHTVSENNYNTSQEAKFLIKGACDFSQVIGYIKDNQLFKSEFNYVSQKTGGVIESHNHSVYLAGVSDLTESEKKELLHDCIFMDEEMFTGSIYNNRYDIVFLSTFPESYAGIYKKKNSNIQVTVGSHLYPITDKKYWKGLLDGSYYCGRTRFTEDYLSRFAEKYEFRGKTTPGDYRERIAKILKNLDKQTKLCLILGVEFACEKVTDPFYKDRHISHALLNKEIREMARENPQLILFDLNETVKHQFDFTHNLNEFTPRVNYDLSQKMIAIINESATLKIENYSRLFVIFDTMLNMGKRIIKQSIPRDNILYNNLKSTYFRLSRSGK